MADPTFELVLRRPGVMFKKVLVLIVVSFGFASLACAPAEPDAAPTASRGFELVRAEEGGPLAGGAFELQSVSPDGAIVLGALSRPRGAAAGVFRWSTASGLDVNELPDGHAADTSADGRVVAGTSGASAFRWTREEGARSLGALPGDARSLAEAASADGGTVVGLSGGAASPWRLFKWTAALGLVALPLPEGAASCDTRAGLTTGDGATTFGRCGPASAPRVGLYRWALGCVEALAVLDDGRELDPRLATADGRVLAGAIAPARSGGPAAGFRWSDDTGVVIARAPFEALGLSRDGAVLVGRTGMRPARWSGGADGVEGLPLPAGFVSGAARSVSDDGALVAGEVAGPSGGPAAAIWTPAVASSALGPMNVTLVADLLRARGVELRGIALTSARVAPDGSTLVGTATVRAPDDALWTAPLQP